MNRYTQHTGITEILHRPLYGLAASQILLSLILLESLPLWVPILAIAVNLIRILPLFGRWEALPKFLPAALAVSATLGVWLRFHTLNGAPAGVSLLLLMAALKTLECRNQRDLVVITLIGFLLTASIFLFGQGIFRSLTGLLVLIWLVTHLKLIHIPNGEQAVLLRELKSSGLQMLIAFPLMLILFILFPRIEGPIWGSPGNQHQGVTGLNNQMTPGSLAQLIQSHAVAFRAHFPAQPPPSRERYWRAYVLDDFNGTTWSAPKPTFRSSGISQSPVTTPIISYTLLMQPSGQRGIPVFGWPVTAPPYTHLTLGYTLYAEQPINSLQEFLLKVFPSSTHLDKHLTQATLASDLKLPSQYAPRARELVDGWLKKNHHPQAVITTALRYFHDQPFYYTLTPPPLSGDITDQFLFNTRRGFCEAYASTFAVLMRLAGIPARIILGYMGGAWNPTLRFFTITQSDAHAWVEVWLKNQGWTRIDPTAAIADSRVESSIAETDSGGLGSNLSNNGWLYDMRQNLHVELNNAGYLWDTFIIAFGPSAQHALLRRLGLKDDVLSLAIELAIGFSTLLGFALILNHWQKRLPPKPPAVRLYEKYLRHLKRHGITRKPNEGAIELAERVSHLWPEVSEQAFRIARFYHEARFSRSSRTDTVHLLHHLDRAIREFRLHGPVEEQMRRER